MKNLFKTLLAGIFIVTAASSSEAREITVYSPQKTLSATVADGDNGIVTLSINHNGTTILPASPVKLNIVNGKATNSIKSAKTGKTVTETIHAPLYRQKTFTTSYNPAVIKLTDGTQLEVRAFNDGIAYRFMTDSPDSLIVDNEIAQYRFPAEAKSWVSYSTNKENPFAMAFQNFYTVDSLKNGLETPAFLPVTVENADGSKTTLLESDLEAYPQMFITASAEGIKGLFPKRPETFNHSRWRKQRHVSTTHNYIANVTGKRTYPWRIFAVTENDTEMPVNNLVYALASPSRIENIDFVKPGKVSWDWWNNWGLTGVPFKAGINMDTYKAHIDFAADNGLEYIILDEGWYDPAGGDMLTTVPEIDLPALVAYGKSKNVDIVLWTVFNVLDDQLEEACAKYKDMGIAGFKVDFLDRADQEAVEMTYRITEAAARHGLALDYHGFYTPTGINRTYPNIINYESVFGMEEMKWSPETVDMPMYEVTFPFIRLMAGPVDFTPGAMRNGSKKNWKAIYSQPMSQGTRAHHLATYVVFDSPFTMLADAPSTYTDAPALEFMSTVPVDVDSTIIVDGKIGQYIVTARKANDGSWWVGGLTSWEPRDLKIDFSFLPQGEYKGYIIRDGANADNIGEDYVKEDITVNNTTTLPIHLASGGGFVIALQ